MYSIISTILEKVAIAKMTLKVIQDCQQWCQIMQCIQVVLVSNNHASVMYYNWFSIYAHV